MATLPLNLKFTSGLAMINIEKRYKRRNEIMTPRIKSNNLRSLSTISLVSC